MSRDYKFEYWKESIECALDESGAASALTPEQIEQVASSLKSSAENQGMAFGHDAIPNPLSAEVRRAEDKLEQGRKEAYQREEQLRSQITSLGLRIRDLEFKLAEARELSRR